MCRAFENTLQRARWLLRSNIRNKNQYLTGGRRYKSATVFYLRIVQNVYVKMKEKLTKPMLELKMPRENDLRIEIKKKKKKK